MRGEPLAISFQPLKPDAFHNAIAEPTSLSVLGEQLSLRNWIGIRPRSYVSIKQDLLSAAPSEGDDLRWILRTNRDVEYLDQFQDCVRDGDRMTCKQTWRKAKAGASIHISPAPVYLAKDSKDRANRPVRLQYRVGLRLDTLAISREFDGGIPVDYASIRWMPRDNRSGFRYPYDTKVKGGDVDTFLKNAPDETTLEQMQAVSGTASFVHVALCPSCMAIRTYECESKESERNFFYCSGDADKELRMSWIATNVSDQWRSDWGAVILSTLVGAGVLSLGAFLLRKAKGAERES